MIKKTVILSILVVLIFAVSTYADVTIKRTDGDFEEIEYYKGTQTAMVDENIIQIFEIDSRRIINIDTNENIYFDVTMDEYKEQMIAYMRGLKDRHMKMAMEETGMTREELEAMQEKSRQMMMEQNKNRKQEKQTGDLNVEKGETKEIAGYESTQYKIIKKDQLLEEIWISEEVEHLITAEVGTDTKKELDEMGKNMEAEMHKVMKEIQGDLGIPQRSTEELDQLRKDIVEKGYVMKEYDAQMDMPMGMTAEMEEQFGEDGMEQFREAMRDTRPEITLTITTDNINSSIFAIPSDARAVSVEEFMITQDEADMMDE